MVTSPARCIRFAKRPDLASHILIDGQRKDVRPVPQPAQEIAHAASTVADGIAPMRRWDPLIDDHAQLGTT